MRQVDRPYSILVHNRPVRLAFLFDRDRNRPATDTLADVDETLDHNQSVWGGRRNPIFFTSSFKLTAEQWSLLEFCDPDVVASFGALDEQQLEAFERSCGPIIILDLSPTHGTQRNLGAWTNLPSLGVSPSQYLIEKLKKDLFSQKPHPLVLFNFGPQCPEAIQRFIRWNFGEFNQSIIDGRTQRGVAIDHLLSEIETRFFEIADIDSLANALTDISGTFLPPKPKSPLYFNYKSLLTGVFQDAPWPTGYTQSAYTVFIGDSAKDIEDFWNGPIWNGTLFHQLWIPTELADAPRFLEALQLWLARFTNLGSNPILTVDYRSSSWSDEKLGNLAKNLRTTRLPISYVVNSTNFRRGLEELKEAKRNVLQRGYVPQRRGGTQRLNAVGRSNTFAIDPPQLVTISGGFGSWIADIQIQFFPEIYGIFRTESWWQFPRPHSLETVYQMFRKPARINLDGIPAVLIEQRRPIRGVPPGPVLEVYLPQHQAVVQAAVSNAPGRFFVNSDQRSRQKRSTTAIHTQISDKGKHLSAMLDLFGSVRDAQAFLTHPFWHEIFYSLVEARNNPDLVSRLSNKLKDLFEKNSISAKANASDFAEELSGLFEGRAESRSITFDELWKRSEEILRKGPQVGEQVAGEQREIARKNLLADLDVLVSRAIFRLGARIRCPNCGWESWLHIDQLQYTQPCSGCGADIRLGAEEKWHYRLNGLVEIAIRQGVIPVLRAVADLIDTGTGVMVSPSLFLYKDVTGGRWKEIDIAIVRDGQLMMGEVKRGKLKTSDIEDLVEVGKTVRPHRVIFVSSVKPSRPIAEKLNPAAEQLSALGVSVEYVQLQDFPSVES